MKTVKLATRLEEQLAGLFFAAATTIVAVSILGMYFLSAQTQEAASHFISSHVKSLVSSGVNSQSVNDIEREVRRLYVAWTGSQKAYQKSDIRILVAIDGVRVGQAGPLKPFGWLSRNHHQTQRLSSGQIMTLKIQTNFSTLAVFVGAIVLFFGVSFFVGFLYLRHLLSKNIKSLTAPLENRMEWLAEVSLRLPDSVRDSLLPQDSSVYEVAELDRSLNAFVQQILRLEERVKEAGIREGRIEVADRVAHSLKGKLAVLRLRIENLQGLAAEDRRKLKESVNGLMMSSKDMLHSGRSVPFVASRATESIALVQHAVQSRNDRERMFGQEPRIEVSIIGDLASDLTIDPIAATRFEDALIAIIDNAMEASTDYVHVRCDVRDDGVKIEITDFGCGIPAEIIPRLLKERTTSGKRDGNGLGLYHAASAVEGVGGRIKIRSKQNVGTTITIHIPRVKLESRANNLVFDTAN